MRLGGAIGSDVVSWQATEDEDDGLDLMDTVGTVSFEPGQIEANMEIRIRGDTEPELDELLIVRLMQVAQVS